MRAEVKIKAPKFTLIAPLGADAPHPTGLGGWATAPRPGNVSITEWTGVEPVRLPLALMFDGFAEGRSVEREYRKILRLGLKHEGTERPPIFRVTGPIPLSGERFVVESDPTFGDTIKSRSGKLLRFSVVLPLMRYVPADKVKFTRKPRYRAFYTVKENESLRKIAVKLYHDASKAKDLGKLNGIRDTRRILKVGLTLRLRDDVIRAEVEEA